MGPARFDWSISKALDYLHLAFTITFLRAIKGQNLTCLQWGRCYPEHVTGTRERGLVT